MKRTLDIFTICGLAVFAVTMLVDRLIVTIPDVPKLLLLLASIVLLLIGMVRLRRAMTRR